MLADPAASPISAVGSAWSPIASLPVARTEAQQAVFEGKLWVIGGFHTNWWDATKRVDIYNPSTNAWSRGPDMPAAITHAATVQTGDDVILLGGYVGKHPGPVTADAWKLNLSTWQWSRLPSLPQPRAGGGAGLVNGQLYYFSGATRAADNYWTRDHGETWSLDLNNPSAGWTARAPMPLPRNHLGFATVAGKVFAVGGQFREDEATHNQSAVHRYDPATNTWASVASLPRTLGHIQTSTQAHNGRILVAGGVTNGFFNKREILSYNPASNAWTQIGQMPAPRKSVSMAVLDGQMVVAGGGDPTAVTSGYRAAVSFGPTGTDTTFVPKWSSASSTPVSLGEVSAGVINGKMYLVGEGSRVTLAYDLSRNSWSSTTQFAQRPVYGHHHAAEVINGKWYLVGGLGGAAGRVQIFDPSANRWTTGASMPWGGGSVSTAVINGKIYAAGGIVGSTSTNSAGTGTVRNAAVYDPAANRWTSLPLMPRGVNHAAAGTDGRRLYIFGGRDGRNVVTNGFATVQVFDTATGRWNSSDWSNSGLKPLPVARGGMGKAVYFGGEFCVIGGETLSGPGATVNKVYNRVDIYRPTTNSWRTGPALPTARHGIFPILHDNRILIAAGGIKAAYSNSRILEVLQLA